MVGTIDLRKHLIGVLVVLGGLIWLSNSPNVGHGYKVKDVEISEAKQLIDAGALVIDVRGKDQFDFRHIPGALLITLDELQQGIPKLILSEAKDRQIVVYCNEGLVHGPEAAAILNKAGYANAVNLKAGIEGWAASGQAIEKS
jgi:rhodanese-related sulfurtransferase